MSCFSSVVVVVESLLQSCVAVSHRWDDATASGSGAEMATGRLPLIVATSSGHPVQVPERVDVRLS